MFQKQKFNIQGYKDTNMFPLEVKKIFSQFPNHVDKLMNTYIRVINIYIIKYKIAKSLIVGKYRNSKVSLNSLIGINKIYDDYLNF